MSERALARTARALDLIPYILDHPGILIEELAKIFGVAPIEIFENLEMLHMCGLPGYSHLELIDLTYEDGIATVLEAQNLDRPRKLSRIEIASIILGLELLSVQVPKHDVRIILLKEKLSQVLGELPLVDLDFATERSELIAGISAALKQNIQIEIDYHSATSDELSHRRVSPYRIYGLNGFAYLEAWCHSVQNVRHFRVDRISQISATSQRVVAIPILEPEDESYDISISKNARSFVEENAAIIESVVSSRESLRIRLNLSNPEWLLRKLISLPGRVQVYEPTHFALSFQEKLQNIRNLYGKPSISR